MYHIPPMDKALKFSIIWMKSRSQADKQLSRGYVKKTNQDLN